MSHITNPDFKFQPKISTSKLIWKYLSSSNLLENADIIDIEDEEKMIGLAAKRFIPAKSPLTENQLQRPKLIKKGSIVNISLVNAYMRLRTQGKSLEDGSLGDMIRIKNIKTKKIILAKVTGAETARIHSFKNHKFQ